MDGGKLYQYSLAVDTTDITYIRTHEGWLYFAVVLDLRQVDCWSMSSRIYDELAMNALLMAIWRRQPRSIVMVHSDQGGQFSSYDWCDFLNEHNLQQGMSRRGNCHDNAVVESFFQLLKRERIRWKIYGTREQARQDVFDYIEVFYNPKRRHSFSNDTSPMEYEKQYFSTALECLKKVVAIHYVHTATLDDFGLKDGQLYPDTP